MLANRERPVLISPKDKGLAMTTLKTAREVRSAEAYFENVGEGELDADLLDMAKLLIQARRKPFQPSLFVDHYEEALRTLIQSKITGETPVYAPVQSPAAVIDLMAALKQSLEKDGAARKPAARGKREAAPEAKAPAKAAAKPAAKAAGGRRKAS